MRIGEIYHHLEAQKIELIEKQVNRNAVTANKEFKEMKEMLSSLIFLQKQNSARLQRIEQFLSIPQEIEDDGSVNNNVEVEDKHETVTNEDEDVQAIATVKQEFIKNEQDDPGLWCLQGQTYLQSHSGEPLPDIPDLPDFSGNLDGNEEAMDEDDDVQVVKFFDLTKHQQFELLQRKRKEKMLKDLIPKEREIQDGVEPFSIKNKKELIKHLKEGMSETIIGPPISQKEFARLYPKIKEWKPNMTRLGDFSGAKRRNTIKNEIDGDFDSIPEEANPNAKRKRAKVTPTTSKGKSAKKRKVVRKFSVFDDDRGEHMKQNEREATYGDPIFDPSSSDSE